MILDNTDEFERLLNNYLPPIDNSKNQKLENFKLYGVSETDIERKEKEYKILQDNKKVKCGCKNSSNNKLKIMHFSLQDALDQVIGSTEKIYICPKVNKYRVYHTTTN